MTGYILRRLAQIPVMLFLVSIVSFTIIQLPPGSFIEQRIVELQTIGGDAASSIVQVEQLKARYGLDKPAWQQYVMWIWGIVSRGDFGESFAYNREVTQIIWSYLGYTVVVSACSFLMVYLIAVPLGIWAATRKGCWPDHAVAALSFIGMSVPEFLLALALLVVGVVCLDYAFIGLFSPQFQFAPWSWAKFIDFLKHLPIPAGLVAVNGTAGIIRITRANMLEALGQQYITAAAAAGLPGRVVVGRYAARMAVNPLVSIIGMSLPGIFSGSTIISIVMNLPTAGLLLFQSLKTQDMYLAGSLILMFSLLLLIGNLLADIALAVIDPRIRYD
ncbi:MAG: ABC transporter permease [bacterium]|nr:ABC transporter permease [Candidatus Sumerlaeota bacterium]